MSSFISCSLCVIFSSIPYPACNCNNRSDRCYFDNDLWLRTGNGGHCLDCSDNRDGPHCEKCKQYFYESPETSRCVACNCDPTGEYKSSQGHSLLLQATRDASEKLFQHHSSLRLLSPALITFTSLPSSSPPLLLLLLLVTLLYAVERLVCLPSQMLMVSAHLISSAHRLSRFTV